MENGMKWKEAILPYLPDRIAAAIDRLDERLPIEEVRVRAGRPLQVCCSGQDRLIYAHGGRPMANVADCAEILTRLCEHSVYAFERELAGGFVTLRGGCRVGVCGRCVDSANGLWRIQDVASINFRIARAVKGTAESLIGRISDGVGGLLPTILVSAPGCGKTTMLRDIARLCANGSGALRPHRVAVVDTRYEIAGCFGGAPQFDVGVRTDVRSGGERAEGIRQMVLTMSPEILITDELSTTEDAYAVLDAASAGVTVVASAHAGTISMLFRRPPLFALISEQAFSRFVLLDRSCGVGTVRGVYDGNGQEIREVEQCWQKRLQCY